MDKRIVLQVIVALGAIFAAYYIGGFQAETLNQKILQATMQGHQAYMIQRFNRAFKTEPPMVAIWEGTNLMSYLSKEPPPHTRTNYEVDLVLIHARLASLYREIDAHQMEHEQIDQAVAVLQAAATKRNAGTSRAEIEQFVQHQFSERKAVAR